MFGSFLQVPRLDVSTLEIQIESGVGWRWDSKEIVLEVVADKTKYMVMSQDQNACRSHHTNIENSSFEKVEDFK
jgi:hypothetical protein